LRQAPLLTARTLPAVCVLAEDRRFRPSGCNPIARPRR
jgi:hypothetical protein